jgi:hypothetical protein
MTYDAGIFYILVIWIILDRFNIYFYGSHKTKETKASFGKTEDDKAKESCAEDEG